MCEMFEMFLRLCGCFTSSCREQSQSWADNKTGSWSESSLFTVCIQQEKWWKRRTRIKYLITHNRRCCYQTSTHSRVWLMWGVFIVHNYSFYVDVNIFTGTISLLIVSCLDQIIISVKRCLVPCEDSLLVFVISANKLRFWVLVSWLEKSSTLKTSLGTCDEHFIDWTINGLDGNRCPGY